MGTRSLTIFRDKYFVYEDDNRTALNNNQKLVDDKVAVLYRQMDGYPDGHGLELATFLKGKKLIDGYSGGDEDKGNFNGIGDLAVRLITYLKVVQARDHNSYRKEDKKKILSAEDTIGSLYLESTDKTDCGQEYGYTIESAIPRPIKDAPREIDILLTVTHNDTQIFRGSPEDFLTFIMKGKKHD
jgi:hypothetical protein